MDYLSGYPLKLMLVFRQASRRVVMVRQGVYQKPRHNPLDVKCISVQMREKLQGRCHIIPTIQTHNGFKYLTVLFPIRDWGQHKSCLSWLSVVRCRRRRQSSRDLEFRGAAVFFSWFTTLSNVSWGKPSSSAPSSSCLSSVLRPASYSRSGGRST